MTTAIAEQHARGLLAELGIAGDEQTPARMAKALGELTAGVNLDPRRHLKVQFEPVATRPTLVSVTDVPFTSVCEHHVLPFTGHATVAYLAQPGQPIVGLSKLARLVQEFAARPQVQERLTTQIVDAIVEELAAVGAAAAIRGAHTCMTLRGARAGADAAMVTSQYHGVFDEDGPWRREFVALLATDAWR